uniref:TYR_PHOSPHATASE_2 domain-containing protein n=1 Tax=Mesocestoides corti TaxID=53468 RepID=A0A5K3F219_MESCO
MPQYPPPRWLDYNPVGKPLRGTWLLPVKLPIPKEKSFHIPRHLWFTDNDLLNFCSDLGHPLSGIIDLTYTNYYDPQLFTRRGVKYAKIFVEGHAIPSASTVKSILMFFVQSLTKSNVFADDMIAIHCTHGVNRTGYLICRYLIDVLGWSANEAISEFELARGYPIERDNYLEDLRRC